MALAPVIFTPEMVQAIEGICQHLDPKDDSQFIFAGIKGWDAMQRVAAESEYNQFYFFSV